MISQILNQIVLSDAGIKDSIEYTDDSGNTAYAFHPNAIPQAVPLPAIAYKVISIDTIETKDNFSGIARYRLQMDMFSEDYALVERLDNKIRKVMNEAGGLFTITDDDGQEIEVDVGVSRHDETTEVYFDEAQTHGRSTEYLIITNRQS